MENNKKVLIWVLDILDVHSDDYNYWIIVILSSSVKSIANNNHKLEAYGYEIIKTKYKGCCLRV